MSERSTTRRRYLRVLGAGGAASLAGCSSGGDTDDETTPTGTPDEETDAPTGDTPGEATETPDAEETPDEETNGDAPSPGALDGAPMFRYDAANTGHAPDETGPTESAAATWTFDTGDKVSSAAVVDGTVYVGSLDGNVYALDAADGTERWTYGADGAVRASPAVVDDAVIVGDAERTVYALTEP